MNVIGIRKFNLFVYKEGVFHMKKSKNFPYLPLKAEYYPQVPDRHAAAKTDTSRLWWRLGQSATMRST